MRFRFLTQSVGHSLRRSRGFHLVLLLIVLAATALAQTSKGTITGTVTDESGAAVVGANVQVSALNGVDIARSTTTGSHGEYSVSALNPGTYVVTVTAPNFATTKIQNVVVTASLSTNTNVSLKVAKVAETVTVEAQGDQLKTDSGEISSSISTREITSLPILGLNPIELALTEPGVLAPSGVGSLSNGVNFSVNGERPRSNNFLIDGADNNDSSIEGQAVQVVNEQAVSEVTVLTNSFSSEFGRGGSVSNQIMKSGTNQFHGSAWELYEGSGIDALTVDQGRNFTDRSSKPRFDQHTYGFTFGGPVIKDKLFFFGTSQWQRFYGNAAPIERQVPSAAGAAALAALTEPGVSARAQQMLAATGGLIGTDFGTPSNPLFSDINIGTRPGCPTNPCIIQFAQGTRTGVPQTSTDTQWQWRVDYLPTSKDTFSFSYLHDRGSFTPDFFNFPDALSTEDTGQGGPSHHAGMTWTHILNPTTVNEFRASWGFFDFSFFITPQALAGPLGNAPAVSITNAMNFGIPTGIAQGRGHHTYQVQEALSKTAGSHNIKVGADVWRVIIRDEIPFNSRGTEDFEDGGDCTGQGVTAGGGTCPALLNYLQNFTGDTGSVAIQFGNPIVRPHIWQLAYYGQDTWRVRQNLTLNYGLRWEYQENPENAVPFPSVDANSNFPFVDFSVPVPVKPDLNNWGPRLGFSYTPHWGRRIFGEDKTVIRGGYGLFYDSQFTNVLDNTAETFPNTAGGSIIGIGGRGLPNASGLFASIAPQPNPFGGIDTVFSDMSQPLTHQWNFDVQRELPWNIFADVAYVGTRGQHLLVNDELNPFRNGSRINPNLGPITIRSNGGDSIYHGLQTKVEHRFSHGLLLRGAYTYSKLIDNGSEIFIIADFGRTSFPQNEFAGGRPGERGLSSYDHRQRLVLSYVYDIPNLHFSEGALNKAAFILRDWNISGTSTFQSGGADPIFLGKDNNRDGRSSNDRPDLSNPNAPLTSWAFPGNLFGVGQPATTFFDGPTFLSTGTLTQVDPTSVHWLVPQPGQLGTAGRNPIVEPGWQIWNFSLTRHFHMPYKEGHTVEFRAEFFNLFNRSNTFAAPWLLLGNPNNFGNLSFDQSGNRTIKFWLKYSF